MHCPVLAEGADREIWMVEEQAQTGRGGGGKHSKVTHWRRVCVSVDPLLLVSQVGLIPGTGANRGANLSLSLSRLVLDAFCSVGFVFTLGDRASHRSL